MSFNGIVAQSYNVATNDQNIDGLLLEIRWASTNVTYSFTDSFFNDYEYNIAVFGFDPVYDNSLTTGFESLNSAQRNVLKQWEAMYESVSLLNLTEVTGANDRDADIRIAVTSSLGTNVAGNFFVNVVENATNDPYNYYSDLWFNQDNFDNPLIGDFAYQAFGHELGHALGLKHGHEGGGVADVTMNDDRNSHE
ncbi:MAG: zinc-dependent metalloprotease family protein, partial [Cyanobacteria bacterium J06649_11]